MSRQLIYSLRLGVTVTVIDGEGVVAHCVAIVTTSLGTVAETVNDDRLLP